MRQVALLLCTVAVSFAAKHNPYVGYQQADYLEEPYITNRALPNHIPQRFTFNFEQVRRDQPTQVEIRDEDIGRYLYKPKQTTTTEIPENYVPKMEDFSSLPAEFNKVEANRRYPSINTHLTSQWTTIPPPPQPSWEALQQNDNLIPEVKKFELVPTTTLAPAPFVPSNNAISSDLPLQFNRIDAARRYPPINTHLTPRPTTTTLSPNTPKWEIITQDVDTLQQGPEVTEDLSAYVSTYQGRRTHKNLRVVSTTERLGPQLRQQHVPARPHGVSRGAHKFDISDLTSPAQTIAPIISTTPQGVPNNRGPPPAVPTLSPWIDGFGK